MQNELDIVRDVSARLEKGGLAYMLTGSMAMNYYAQPRMTRDIDLVVALTHTDRSADSRLLDELGWGLNLEHEATSGVPLDPARSYRYGIEGGAEPVDGVAEGTLIFCGASLLSLAREELDNLSSLADARRLLRAALDRLLDGRPLRTREVALEMRAHAGKADGG